MSGFSEISLSKCTCRVYLSVVLNWSHIQTSQYCTLVAAVAKHIQSPGVLMICQVALRIFFGGLSIQLCAYRFSLCPALCRWQSNEIQGHQPGQQPPSPPPRPSTPRAPFSPIRRVMQLITEDRPVSDLSAFRNDSDARQCDRPVKLQGKSHQALQSRCCQEMQR